MKLPSLSSPLAVLVGLALMALAFAGLALAGFGEREPLRRPLPDAVVGQALATAPGLETAVFAGGCFWGVEAVFEHVRGVHGVRSGYAGGTLANPSYAQVTSGRSGHAESVEVRFDPRVVSYGQLLKVFFAVAHDPTQLDRQGPDRGSQYRSAIFTRSPAQERAARAYLRQLATARSFGPSPIVTRVQPLERFYPAEDYHQDFARLNPDHPYIRHWDAPKLVQLQRRLPALYRAGGLAAK